MSAIKFLTKTGGCFYVIGKGISVKEFSKQMFENGIFGKKAGDGRSFCVGLEMIGFKNIDRFKSALAEHSRFKFFNFTGSLFGLVTKVIAESDDEVFKGINVFYVSDFDASIKKLKEDAIPNYLKKFTEYANFDDIISVSKSLLPTVSEEAIEGKKVGTEMSQKKEEKEATPTCKPQIITINKQSPEVQINLSEGFINSLFIKTCDYLIKNMTQREESNGVLNVSQKDGNLEIHLLSEFAYNSQSNDLIRYLSSNLDNSVYKYYLPNRNGMNYILAVPKDRQNQTNSHSGSAKVTPNPVSADHLKDLDSDDDSSDVESEPDTDADDNEKEERKRLAEQLASINHLGEPTNAYARRPEADVIKNGPDTGVSIVESCDFALGRTYSDHPGKCFDYVDLARMDMINFSDYIFTHSKLDSAPCRDHDCIIQVRYAIENLSSFVCCKGVSNFELNILRASYKSILFD